MDTNDLKNDLQGVFDKLKELEARARELQNQNLADVVASAHGKIKQLCDHPDLALVTDKNDNDLNASKPGYVPPTTKEDAIARMRADGNADPEGTARMNWPHLFDGGGYVAPFDQRQPGQAQPNPNPPYVRQG